MESLRELSDRSFQERVWVRREGGEISSPAETMNQLFDDSGLGDILERGQAFSANADAALRQLSKVAETIDLEQPIDALLAGNRWQEIRQLAIQAMKEIQVALRMD